MQLDDAQAQLLKNWLVKKLENDSDADSDVLADYVLALVRGDGTPQELRVSCIENLRDFLQDGTETFVDQVITALKTRSYDPSQTTSSQSLERLPPTGPRKRTFDNRGDDSAPSGRFGNGERPMKQMRRGGRGNKIAQNTLNAGDAGANMNFPQGMSMQEALGAMMAMQQAMGLPPLAGMEQFGTQTASGVANPQRCRDFDTKGVCPRGAACPYEHGIAGSGPGRHPLDPAVVPQLGGLRSLDAPGSQRGHRGRGRARNGISRGGRRSEYSSTAPNSDRSITTIVVEQIPDDKLDEEHVRDFFNEFGTIQDLELQPFKKLALITFSTWDEANAAYKSPKVIFDNRFVKVFWHKPAQTSNAQQNQLEDVQMTSEEPAVDREEVAKRQEEAQKKHEETKKLRDQAASQKAEIEFKLKAMEAERAKMMEILARKTGHAAGVPASNTNGAAPETEQTKGLKAQLAKLEAEAKSLGIDPSTEETAWESPAWRGRGSSRGRYTPWGRGRGSMRGGWPPVTLRGGAVKRLDNRPRTVAVIFPTGTFEDLDEAMRQYLLFTNQFEQATLSNHPDRKDAAMLVFEERYRAEAFIASTKGPDGIPNIGAVETAWMPNPISATQTTPSTSTASVPMPKLNDRAQIVHDTKMGGADPTAEQISPAVQGTDLDVDEGSQWD